MTFYWGLDILGDPKYELSRLQISKKPSKTKPSKNHEKLAPNDQILGRWDILIKLIKVSESHEKLAKTL